MSNMTRAGVIIEVSSLKRLGPEANGRIGMTTALSLEF